MRVRIHDFANKILIELDCPIPVLYATEPIPCKLIASSTEIEVKRSLLERIFPFIKPKVMVVANQGFYIKVSDEKSLDIYALVKINKESIELSPNPLIDNWTIFNDYSSFIQYVSNVLNDNVNYIVKVLNSKYSAIIDTLKNNAEAVTELAGVLSTAASYNVDVARLTNSVLSKLGLSIQDLISIINNELTKTRQLQDQLRTLQAFMASRAIPQPITPVTPTPATETTNAPQAQGG